MKIKAAFLDRDNTLIKDNGYTFCTDDLIWAPDAILCLSLLYSIGYKLIVITNQSGIARGYYTEEDMDTFHTFMNKDLIEKTGIMIDKFYHCPHFPNGDIKQYSKSCNCRKPGDELFQKAILDFSIEPNQSIVIGNKVSDIIPAINQGINKGFLLQNNGNNEPLEDDWSNIIIVNNWSEIIKNINNRPL